MQTSTKNRNFSIVELRHQLKDLFVPNPWTYWADFLISVSMGYVAGAIYLGAAAFSWQQILSLAVAVSCLYRVAIYMHEIVHFKRREMVGFKIGWNLLAGIPMLSPSFLYESHLDHHNTQRDGTEHDGEYLPLGHGPVAHVLLFLAQPFYLPLYFAVRFLLVPVSFLHPKLRQWVLERVSSNVINLRHRREIPADAPRRIWAALDLACSLRIWFLVGLPVLGPILANHYPWLSDRFPVLQTNLWWRPVQLYVLAVCIVTLNHWRTLVAHRYQSLGDPISHQEQLLDSVDIIGDPLFTEVLCPLGLRYHALHHLFPALPYHNLGKAHRRLMATLPADSPYRQIVYANYWTALKAMVKGILQGSSDPEAGVRSPHRRPPSKQGRFGQSSSAA